MKKLPKSWTTVTPLSKTIALLLFIALPFIGVTFGMKYQKALDTIEVGKNITGGPASTTRITKLLYTKDCAVGIDLDNGQNDLVTPTKKERVCTGIYPPVISADGKLAAFEIDIIAPDKRMTGGRAVDNSVFVYFISQNNFARVYQYGAAHVKSMTFDTNDNLKLTVSNGEISDRKTILLGEIERNFTNVVDPLTHDIKYSASFLPERVLQSD